MRPTTISQDKIKEWLNLDTELVYKLINQTDFAELLLSWRWVNDNLRRIGVNVDIYYYFICVSNILIQNENVWDSARKLILEIESLHKENISEKESLNALKTELKFKDSHILNLKYKISNLEMENCNLRNKISESEKEISKLKQKISASGREISKLNRDWKKAESKADWNILT